MSEPLPLDLRDQYLISRALCSLECELDKVKGRRREESDLADVRLLIETAFPMWKSIEHMLNINIEEANKDGC